MKKQNNWNKVGWAMIFLVIIVNLVLLYWLKKRSLDTTPLDYLTLERPTLVVIFNEFECASCVEGLMFLNELYVQVKDEGKIGITGIILSKEKTDRKNIAKAFVFPIIVSDDFNILRRLNMNKTPIILGVSLEHRILYSDIVPFETGISEEYIKKGVLDRLYYSLYY